MESLANDLNKIADFLEAVEKQAGLITVGDSVVCLNPIEGVVKGQKYRVTGMPRENYVAVEDLYGNEIGCFRADRFCLDNNEY